MDLQVHADVRGDWAVVVVSGELDVETVRQLSDRLDEVITAAPSGVVMDFGKLSFIDSAGLSLVVDAHRRVEAAGGQLRLASVQPFVYKLFRVTQLTEVLHIHDTVLNATA
jgi:anti-anti-sigma factor